MHMLRLAFLVPAIVDLALAVLTLYRMIGVVDDSLIPRGQFAGAAACWALLLLMGMSKPVARAWILLPTAILIGCIGVVFFLGFMAGTVSVARMVLALVLCGTMIWLCWAGLKYVSNYQNGKELEG
jgi:hypothetical protein